MESKGIYFMSTKKNNFLKELSNIQQKAKLPKKKRKDSKKKGNKGELDFCKIMNKRFKTHHFIRTPSSGALVGGSNYQKRLGLDEDLIAALASDIMVPKKFNFSVEHKSYSSDNTTLNVYDLLFKNNNSILEWWQQCTTDAKKAKKNPMLVIKIDYQKRFCIIESSCDPPISNINYIEYNLFSNSIWIYPLEDLLKLDKKFWGI